MSEIGNCLYKEDIWLTQNVFKWEHSLHLTLERNIKDFLKDSLEQKDNYAIKLIRTKLKLYFIYFTITNNSTIIF